MTTIKAKGKTDFGEQSVTVQGDAKVETVEASSKGFAGFIRWGIDQAVGSMANNYHPEGGTMLQAYAFLTGIFGVDAVTVDGDLEEIPHGEEGVLY